MNDICEEAPQGYDVGSPCGGSSPESMCPALEKASYK